MCRYQSFTEPPALYACDLDALRCEILERDAVPFPSGEFEADQVWVRSRDGVRFPMFVCRRRGLPLDGRRPTILYGYGGFRISLLPEFRPDLAVWLERGGILAAANVRGGAEFGEDWHRAGQLDKKQNVFDDFISAAEWLISAGYTNPGRLGTMGTSNGGLLVGAAAVQRPDLFQAVCCQYPILDVLRFHEFVGKWSPGCFEFGYGDDPEHFKFLHAYSPYHNVTAGTPYPAFLLTTSHSDVRAPMARKMTALLQWATASDWPILLQYHGRHDHGGRDQPVGQMIEDMALELAFLSWQLGAA
jgi:prolyl oligopeptidase